MEFPTYTKEQFLHTEEPYKFVYSLRDNEFLMRRAQSVISENANIVKVKNFSTLYKAYVNSQKKPAEINAYDNATNFDGQEFELLTGAWQADELGITTYTPNAGEIVACAHPIMPVQRLVNIDTGTEKLKIAYKRGTWWRSTIEERKTLANPNSIIELANKGIAVNSINAKDLIKYLADVETLNYERIPEKSSVSRLGWINDKWFSPYVDELVFDGDSNFKTFFDSVGSKGSYKKWLEMAREVRKESVYGRIILAASFSSVLVKPLSCLPFFVHLWGGTEVGKTVGLMLAASVWANPEPGRFIHTFNSTAVGREKSAGFVNSLPLILDELQILNDKKKFDQDIYLLSEGTGRTRGTIKGGIDKSSTWNNCILTSGEQPITSVSSGGGAVNRIIEVECKEKLFANPRGVADTVRKHFGYGGKAFVEKLTETDSAEINAIFSDFKTAFDKLDTTEKQAMAVCVVLTADALATKWIFQDDRALTVEEVLGFLQTRKAVSQSERAYEYLCEYVASNRHKFCGKSEFGEVWGDISEGMKQVFIVRSYFNKICEEQGYNPQAFLSWLKQSGKIELNSSGRGFTKTKKINGVPCNCVVMQMLEESPFEQGSLL